MTTQTRCASLLAASFVLVLAAACERGREADNPPQPGGDQPPNQYGQGQPPNAYGPPQQQNPGQYAPPQNGQPPPGYGNPPQQQQPTPAPNPFALPCSSDVICGTHKCNMQTGRCSIPCQSNNDCAAGFTCVGSGQAMAVCLPGGQH